jgi:hypothetical protein
VGCGGGLARYLRVLVSRSLSFLIFLVCANWFFLVGLRGWIERGCLSERGGEGMGGFFYWRKEYGVYVDLLSPDVL